MELDEIKDSAKVWFNDRLKNPYFAAVLAVWLITNRVIVFSVFNFSEELNLQERISFIHQQLQNKSVWKFQGFYGIILYSFIVGFFTMIAFNYLNVIGKWSYNYFGKWANSLRKNMAPTEWVSRKEAEKVLNDLTIAEEDISTKKIELKRLQKENDDAIILYSNTKKDYESIDQELDVLRTKVTNTEAQLESKTKEYNGFLEQLEKHKEELSLKTLQLESMVSITRDAPKADKQWIYRGTCLVHDYTLEGKYKISIDTYCDSTGWEIQLFGRGVEDSDYLFQTLGKISGFLPEPFDKYVKWDSRLIFNKLPFTANIIDVAENLKLLLSRLEAFKTSSEKSFSKIEIKSAVYVWNGGQVDVSKRLKELISSGIDTIIVDPSVFNIPDPAYGIVKTLFVDYSINGQEKTIHKIDGERFKFD